MNVDDGALYEALVARDPRFDGVFYVGVTTTGVYCRPICPARTPGRARCRFFGAAAVAEQAGFRPCLRCRPEIAPGLADVDDRAGRALMRFAVDSWDPGYGTSLGIDGPPETVTTVIADVEVTPDQWSPIGPSAINPPRATIFVDGVRRIDARVWIGGGAGGEASMALCASYAAGAVCCCDVGAHFLPPESLRVSKFLKPSLNWLLVFFPLAIWAEVVHRQHAGWASPTVVFALSAIAIIPVAGWMGHATEHLASRLGEGIGGLLNATFGNAAELIIACMALWKASQNPESVAAMHDEFGDH